MKNREFFSDFKGSGPINCKIFLNCFMYYFSVGRRRPVRPRSLLKRSINTTRQKRFAPWLLIPALFDTSLNLAATELRETAIEIQRRLKQNSYRYLQERAKNRTRDAILSQYAKELNLMKFNTTGNSGDVGFSPVAPLAVENGTNSSVHLLAKRSNGELNITLKSVPEYEGPLPRYPIGTVPGFGNMICPNDALPKPALMFVPGKTGLFTLGFRCPTAFPQGSKEADYPHAFINMLRQGRAKRGLANFANVRCDDGSKPQRITTPSSMPNLYYVGIFCAVKATESATA